MIKQLVIFCFIPFMLSAQNHYSGTRKIRGEVIEFTDNNERIGIPDANVTIKETGDQSVSDSKGFFAISISDTALKPREKITFVIDKPGWKIKTPNGGIVSMPYNPIKDPITITLIKTDLESNKAQNNFTQSTKRQQMLKVIESELIKATEDLVKYYHQQGGAHYNNQEYDKAFRVYIEAMNTISNSKKELPRLWLTILNEIQKTHWKLIEANEYFVVQQLLTDILADKELDVCTRCAILIIEITNLLGSNKLDIVTKKLEKLSTIISAQAENFSIGFAFEQTKAFINQNEKFRPYREWLNKFLSAMEGEDKMRILNELLTLIKKLQLN